MYTFYSLSSKRKVKVLLEGFVGAITAGGMAICHYNYVAIPWPFSQCFQLYLSRTTMKLAGK